MTIILAKQRDFLGQKLKIEVFSGVLPDFV